MAYVKSQSEGNLEEKGGLFIRYALVAVLVWIGALKFTAYESEGVFKLASNSPMLAWGYHLVSMRTFAGILGLFEWTFAILISIRPISAKISALGSFGAIGMFLITLTFLITTPGVWQPDYGFPYLSPNPGQFLLKDLVLLGAAIWTAGESLRAARETTLQDARPSERRAA
ncbi:MAG: DUF417 family protein [Acidobacteriales bacterium]|nr:DUF417 family protein [Terriglobales bacterium]